MTTGKLALLLLLFLVVLAAASWMYLRHALASAEAPDSEIETFYREPARPSPYAMESEPCANQYPLGRAFFGALHIHTRASFDATAFGVTNDADHAYAFARGEEVELRLEGDDDNAEVPRVRIDRPLDFAAVTDHAEQMGERRICLNPSLTGYDSLLCKVYRGDLRLSTDEALSPLIRLASQAIFGQSRSVAVCGADGQRCREEARSGWLENQRAAEQWQDHSENCEFTTFHGYEYSLAREASNLHRNVIFANAELPPAVVSARDKRSPEALWEWLQGRCRDSDGECDVITIPHNSNWSSGQMWYPYHLREELSPQQRREYAALRKSMEPLAEIMQVKGDSECRNGLYTVLGARDEFCDFEKLRAPEEPFEDCGELTGSGNMRLVGCLSRFSYVRYALSAGLAEQQQLGVNPFRLGIVAATDNHNATAAANSEASYFGANGPDRNARNRLRGNVDVPGGIARGSPIRYNPGGVAGVWAKENSRAALFEAMRRRETFGTSGPRIVPRFFAGADLDSELCGQQDMVAQAYEDAVPMGGTLAKHDSSPVFLASATRDPEGGLLERLQVVKGWIDEQGRTHQAVYDIAGESGAGRASVDPDTCQTSGPGHDQLCTSWRDPDFEAGTSSVYYLRVLENPSCRWSTYQCNSLPER